MKNLSPILLILYWLYQSLAWAAATCNSNIPESTPSAAFNLTATDGTVVHNPTGLIWSRCALGQTWNQGTLNCDNAATTHTWVQALTEANNSTLAGFTDWRLPNLKEFSSIVERKCVNPTINESAFPATPSSFFWSASAFANGSVGAWVVVFNFGFDSFDFKFNTNQVRLVRGGQLFDSFDINQTYTVGGMVSGLD
ncbi:MAG: DUF1566 domain-containing protein, partial [Methylococcales bacterium]